MKIVEMLFGSHLYGTATPASDLDYKAVHLPTRKEILLQRVVETRRSGPEKTGEGVRNAPGDVDTESFSLQRYLQLLAQGQTVAVDMLFAPVTQLLWCSDTWGAIYENRHRLLTKKSAAFVGYCRTQANKYGIKGSRVAAARAAAEFFRARPMAAKVGEFEAELHVQLLTAHGEHCNFVEQRVNSSGAMGRFFVCCNRMVGLGNTVKEAAQIFTRIHDSYGDRARLAQNNQGIDWKALSHAVRVGREAVELLSTGHITFPRPEAQHLLAIKTGALSYVAVAEEIEALLIEVETAATTSALPDTADQALIDNIVLEAYDRVVRTW